MALRGLRVLELAGLAPVPFVGRMLADLGASVVRLDRPGGWAPDVLAAGKRSLAVDTRSPAGIELVQRLLPRFDVLLDPFRPGTLESMGLGPAAIAERNPSMIVARVSGYGGAGYGTDFTRAAGHDINYASMSGLLSMMGDGAVPAGRAGGAAAVGQQAAGAASAAVAAATAVIDSARPRPPLNLLGDFAGGSALATVGILAALYARGASAASAASASTPPAVGGTGSGSVVDASMTHGAAYLGSLIFNLQAAGMWSAAAFLQPGTAPYYDTYATSDVLSECGLSGEEVAALLAAGVVKAATAASGHASASGKDKPRGDAAHKPQPPS